MEFKKGDYIVESGKWSDTVYRVVSISPTGRITGLLPSGVKCRVGERDRYTTSPTIRIATPANVKAYLAEEERSRQAAIKHAADIAEARAGLTATDFSTLPEYLVLDIWRQVKQDSK